MIREGCVSKRTLPANLQPADAALFEHERESVIPPMHLLELRGVGASAEGLLFKSGRILRESFAVGNIMEEFLARKRSVLKFLAANYLGRRRKSIARRCLWITDDWSSGYFHWVTDALPRLFVVKELARELVLLLPAECETLDFVSSSVRLFHPGGVEYVRRSEVFRCEQLVLPTHAAPTGSYNDPLMRELRGFIRNAYGLHAEASAHRRIYISRGRAPKRRVVNEEDLNGVLHEFDFEVVRCEDLSFEQQVRIAGETQYLISNHGAGLTNMLFMPPGGAVLELRRSGERERNCFFNLATAAQLDYYYQNCQTERPGDRPHTANVIVDAAAVRENLARMLDRGSGQPH